MFGQNECKNQKKKMLKLKVFMKQVPLGKLLDEFDD